MFQIASKSSAASTTKKNVPVKAIVTESASKTAATPDHVTPTINVTTSKMAIVASAAVIDGPVVMESKAPAKIQANTVALKATVKINRPKETK